MLVPLRPDERWSLDFVPDQVRDSRRFRILAIVDDCTRECLALVVDTSLSGMRVARELDRLVAERGRPRMIPDQVRDQRQWHRVNLERHPRLGGSEPGRMALRRAGQADAERLHRRIQRPPAQ